MNKESKSDAVDSKSYFLTRKKELVECELVSATSHKRVVKILEGSAKGKNKAIHPDGVAWGKLYPRLFTCSEKPSNFFVFKGRVLLKQTNDGNGVPSIDSNYRFQPFLSHVIDNINQKENTLLTGGAGVGKTTHVEQLAARCNQPLLRVNLNGETRLSDFIGKLNVIGGETVWVDGILPMAMKKGWWLLLDEVDFADPAILSLLHPVLEENPCLVIKENKGEVIKPHPSFRIFATANSIGAMQERAGSYSGTNTMNEAFMDRWQVVMVPNLPLKEEVQVVKSKVGGLKHRWAKRIVEFAHKVREKSVDGMEFSSDTFSTRRVLSWAKKTALLRSPIEGAKIAWLDKVPASDHEALLRILSLHFGNSGTRKSSKSETVAVGEPPVGKKRGRPAKNSNNMVAKRGRGRPRKNAAPVTTPTTP